VSDEYSLGPIEIRLPPDPALSRVLRLAASGVASLANYTVDEIDDIKIAVSEVLIALIEHGAGAPVDIQFDATVESFRILGRTATDDFDTANPDLVLCRRVLEGVGAEHGVELNDGKAEIWATIRHLSIE
jgi:hypothetical protein